MKPIPDEARRTSGRPDSGRVKIPVASILGKLSVGMTEAEILDDYPDAEADDVRAAMRYAADTATH